MMTDVEMTDAEVREQIERTDRFIEQLREMIAASCRKPGQHHKRGISMTSACSGSRRRSIRCRS